MRRFTEFCRNVFCFFHLSFKFFKILVNGINRKGRSLSSAIHRTHMNTLKIYQNLFYNECKFQTHAVVSMQMWEFGALNILLRTYRWWLTVLGLWRGARYLIIVLQCLLTLRMIMSLEKRTKPCLSNMRFHTYKNQEKLTFQQDGAPPRYSNQVKAYVDRNLPSRWIYGGYRSILRLQRSPDLSLYTFF